MERKDCGCTGSCGERAMPRRQFITTAAAGGAGLAAALSGVPIAGPFFRQAGVDHFVPADKKLSPAWIEALFARGGPAWYAGDDLETIGMPVGGICAGQVYLAGDGRLLYWDVFNQNQNTGYGAVNYAVGRPAAETVAGGQLAPSAAVDQGFAIRVKAGGRTIDRTLDRRGFPGVRFRGEYPIGFVEYLDPALPVETRLAAFSPFIPLNAADSALPAIVLEFTVRNASDAPAEVTLAGWLENAVCRPSAAAFGDRFVRRNSALAAAGLAGFVGGARALALPERRERPPVVFADFEGGSYGAWTAEGGAFGTRPATGALADQQVVEGFEGRGLVDSFLGGDDTTGVLRSPAFTIERPFISFLVGGGRKDGTACVNLLVDGRVVRTATGANRERLEPHNWDVSDLAGRTARIEIVDRAQGDWGHVNVDQIEFRDGPRIADPGALDTWSDYGTMCLAVAGQGFARPSIGAGPVLDAADAGAEGPAGDRLRGAAGRTLAVSPGDTARFVFVVAWHMPNLRREDALVGNFYATRFAGAGEVAAYVVSDLERLTRQTRLWHRTYYDSTLPWWLLDRLHSTVANLATTTAQWWRNGRFWAWEGAGCCRGTCGHVWNYEHAMARLFPELERSAREMQDFAPGVGFDAATGAIGFRGERSTWAGDAQGGYILKALREHQTSPDRGFLERTWPRVRQAAEFLIGKDGDDDGLIEGAQPQTYDQDYYGPNTMVGSLYLGALRAAEVMAREMGDAAFAERCRRIFESGRDKSVAELFNGEYFVQKVDLKAHPDWQYADGCLADQMFGQGWAHQVGLGYLYPRDTVVAALKSIWKYCWAPDVGPQDRAHAPERWFAYPGEAGLFTCTWPKSPHLGPKSTRYRNEIWTGIEYQVAGHMAWEGLTTEALAICRGVHERYHPSKHNPWNEIECGDHYARAMASWGVLTGLSGFEHFGPRGRIGFAPRIAPGDFRAPFTAAEGWGTLSQRREGNAQTSEIAVRWGRVAVGEAAFELPEGRTLSGAAATIGDRPIEIQAAQDGSRVTLTLPAGAVVEAGSALRVVLRHA